MTAFSELTTMEELEQFLQENTYTFLYISQPNCSVCHGLEPQIKRILDEYPRIVARKVNATEVPEVAGKFTVFTAPVLLLFIDGKEYIREARIVQTARFQEQVQRLYENVIDN